MGPERDRSLLAGLADMKDVRERLTKLSSEGRPVGIEEVLQVMRESRGVYEKVAGGRFVAKAVGLGKMISLVEEEIKEAPEKREILLEEIFKAAGVERKRR